MRRESMGKRGKTLANPGEMDGLNCFFSGLWWVLDKTI